MKNIVNPVPEIFEAALPEATTVGGIITSWSNIPERDGNGNYPSLRRGPSVEWYEDERNKFIIDMIHLFWEVTHI